MWSAVPATANRVSRHSFHHVGCLLPVVIFRSFFPDLSGVVPQANERTHKEKRVVPFSQEQFFSVVADVDNYKKFVPFCVDSKVVRVIDAQTMEADMSVGFKEVYTSRVVMKRPAEVSVKASQSRLFSSLHSTWKFRPGKAPGTTMVDFSVTFEAKNLLAAQAMDAFFDEVALQQVKAFERRCRQLYGVTPGTKRKRAAEEAAAAAAGKADPCGGFLFPVKDALAVASDVNVVKDACLRHFGQGAKVEDGLTEAQFKAACSDLANEKGFGNFKELAEDKGLAAAVYSSLKFLMRRRLSRGLTSLKGAAGDEAKACLASAMKGVPEGAMLEFAISVYMMVQASPEDRALYIFSILDTNGNKQLERQELQAALLLYMKSLARVIPTVVEHQFKGMGKLVDSDLVKEEIVHVVDEVRALTANDFILLLDRKLMHEVTADIPRAVDQIFEELGVDVNGCISEDEWEGAWQNFPELLDMMSLRGLGKTATWAAIVLDKVVAKQHLEGGGEGQGDRSPLSPGGGGPHGVP